MHPYHRKLLVVLMAAVSFYPVNAQKKKPAPQPAPAAARDTAKPAAPPAPSRGPKAYKEVITDKALTGKGLLWVHQLDTKWYFELGDSLLNRDILIVNRISKGPANLRSGTLGYAGDEINQNVVRFEKGPNHKIFLRNISYSVYSRDTSGAMHKSVMNSNIQPIAAVFDIRAYSADSSGSVIEMTDILNGDNDVFFFAGSVKTHLRLGGIQTDKSYIASIRPYPINTEIRTVKTYSRSAGSAAQGSNRPPANPPSGQATFELNSSMVLLPAIPMRPRYFDDRVAYFTTGFTDFDADPHGVKNVSLITRWRLEPRPEDLEKYKNGEPVEPVKPIVFYIDPATPAKWVPYLIQGVNDWQKAFAKAGFKNAIIGKPAPTYAEDSTWSLEDARYSALVYKPSEVQNASGPHIHDPRSGEILESHINWYHNIMHLLYRWYLVQTAAVDTAARKPSLDDELMGQLIRFVAAHEVGHTLGLPHNMGASSATPVEKLRDKAWVEKHGHTASIMDYARFNYVAQPQDGITQKGLFPRINDYDEWAIEWGYRLFPGKSEAEEKTILNDWVKSKASNPRLRFIHMGSDPRAQTEDLGDNAMKAGAYGILNLKRILPQLPAWLNEEGETFDKLSAIYNEVLTQYSRYMGHALANIGGVYTDSKTSDQPGAVYTPVPRVTQKEAMNFLHKHLLETPNWLADKKILSLVAAPGGSNDRIGSIQDSWLNSMLAASRLNRMIASTNRSANTYTVEEYFNDLRKALWSELQTKKPIDNYRRNLQKSFVERLSAYVNPSATPSSGGGGIVITIGPVVDPRKSDILSLSKATLRSLKQEISAALPAFSDKMSRYHLIDIQERITKALSVD